MSDLIFLSVVIGYEGYIFIQVLGYKVHELKSLVKICLEIEIKQHLMNDLTQVQILQFKVITKTIYSLMGISQFTSNVSELDMTFFFFLIEMKQNSFKLNLPEVNTSSQQTTIYSNKARSSFLSKLIKQKQDQSKFENSDKKTPRKENTKVQISLRKSQSQGNIQSVWGYYGHGSSTSRKYYTNSLGFDKDEIQQSSTSNLNTDRNIGEIFNNKAIKALQYSESGSIISMPVPNQSQNQHDLSIKIRGIKRDNKKRLKKLKLTPISSRVQSVNEKSHIGRQILQQMKDYSQFQQENQIKTLSQKQNVKANDDSEEIELEQFMKMDLNDPEEQVSSLYNTIAQSKIGLKRMDSDINGDDPNQFVFKPDFNIRQCNYLFVRAVESKFNDDLKPQYVKEMEVGHSTILGGEKNDEVQALKGFKKSELVLKQIKQQLKSRRTDDGKAISTRQAILNKQQEQLDQSKNGKQAGSNSRMSHEPILARDLQNYYSSEDNFQDDLPYDLYNMVEMYKQISKAQVLPYFSEIKHDDLRNFQNLRKYKHKMLDINTETNREFLEGQYHKLLEKRLTDQQKSITEQNSRFASIEKYNGHYDISSIKKKLRKKEIETLNEKVKEKLLNDFLPYYTLKSGGKQPKDLLKEMKQQKKQNALNYNQNNF
ncbi:UNKNOWN [Stylonychia lemnae]|uniref:Uncharacterized protein n=1 Tax=Stylonychia lemnae TaxID=5949 RepID=A0A078AUZ1_STYLE|nr:UNKNOWN [Stylonychia lemnae]|eukprot:CDW85816.1 UNKNOWN [Stylonychia lemnae]